MKFSKRPDRHSILESYSGVVKSLANTIMSVLYADSLALDQSLAAKKMPPLRESSPSSQPSVILSPLEETEKDAEKLSSTTWTQNSTSITLSDFMSWNLDQIDSSITKRYLH
jgi:hypothetical protein